MNRAQSFPRNPYFVDQIPASRTLRAIRPNRGNPNSDGSKRFRRGQLREFDGEIAQVDLLRSMYSSLQQAAFTSFNSLISHQTTTDSGATGRVFTLAGLSDG